MNFDLNTTIAVREREDGLLEKDTFDLNSAMPIEEVYSTREVRDGKESIVNTIIPKTETTVITEETFEEEGLQQDFILEKTLFWNSITGGLYPVVAAVKGMADQTKADKPLWQAAIEGIVEPETTRELYQNLPEKLTYEMPRWAQITAGISENVVLYGAAGIAQQKLLVKKIARDLSKAAAAWVKDKFLPAGPAAEEALKNSFMKEAISRWTAVEAAGGVRETLGKLKDTVPTSRFAEYVKRQNLLKLVVDELRNLGKAGQIGIPKAGQTVSFLSEGKMLTGIIKEIQGQRAIIDMAGKQVVAMLSTLTMPVKAELKLQPEIVEPELISKGKQGIVEGIPQTGKPFEGHYIRNIEKAPYVGEKFGQNLEPSGKYITVTSKENIEGMLRQKGFPVEKYEQGIVKFNNPLVLEHKETGVEGWKKDLSEMFGGKTKKALSNAIMKKGYDGIITIDEDGNIRETVILRQLPQPKGERETAKEIIPPPPKEPPPTAVSGEPELPEEPIQIKNLDISPEAKTKIKQTIEEIRPELEDIKGKPLTQEEVIEAAKTSDILTNATSREATKVFEAKLLRTRQHLAALAEQKGVSQEFIETLKAVRTAGTDLGRGLGSLRIEAAGDEYNLKTKVVNKLVDMGVEVSKIIKAAEGVDFNNQEQVTQFYRQFVKPSLWDIINEYRYINLLSSPKTHIVNAFTNLMQVVGVAPATKILTGDLPGASAYYRGVWKSLGTAGINALDALKGKTFMERPDVAHIPTGSKLLKWGRYIPQALEAGDVFFRTLAYEGELASQAAKGVDFKEAMKIAKERAAELVFRKALDPKNKTGQGHLLSAIDNLTSLAYKARNVPVFGRLIGWYIPFVQTPMSIAKQMIEYSPAGFTTLPGAKDKKGQLAKSFLGSLVFATAAYLVYRNDSTWSVPTNKKERDLFFAAGRQPFSIKIGNVWIGYSRLGPLALPIAIPAAVKYYTEQNPKSATDNSLQKTAKVIGGLGEFFASMSYVEGIGQLMGLIKNAPGAAAKLAVQAPSQLIPLSSLQRWINNFIIDPIYRKIEKDFSLDALIEEARKSIIFTTKGLPAYENPDGEESRRSYPGFNAFSPIPVTKTNREYEEEYKQYIEGRKESLIEKKESGDEPRRRLRRKRR